MTDCVHAPSGDWVNSKMNDAHEVSKRGKWANFFVRNQDMFSEFEVKKDYTTRLFVSAEFIIFEYSAIEYFFKRAERRE